MVTVKICGNRRPEDALMAAKYGADAVGLLVGQKHVSPDFITPQDAKNTVQQLPSSVASVLVTHLASPDEIISLAKRIDVTTIQLHGDTTPEQARKIKAELPYIELYKAIHVTGEEALEKAEAYVGAVDAIVLDTINVATNQVGGTGRTHDWAVSARIVKKLSMPVILAGGLNPDNVAEAIRQVRPSGVDVNTGVKGLDSYKDPIKVQQFIERAQASSVS